MMIQYVYVEVGVTRSLEDMRCQKFVEIVEHFWGFDGTVNIVGTVTMVRTVGRQGADLTDLMDLSTGILTDAVRAWILY
jgi:hypothetical protein